jgi:hypothetical protein
MHRGDLADSMATEKEMAPTMQAVVQHLRGAEIWMGEDISLEDVTVKPYGYDSRIGWDIHLVLYKGYPYAFTDGPLSSGPTVEEMMEDAKRADAMQDEIKNAAQGESQMLEEHRKTMLKIRRILGMNVSALERKAMVAKGSKTMSDEHYLEAIRDLDEVADFVKSVKAELEQGRKAPEHEEIVKKGRMVMKDGLAWGIGYEDGYECCYGWVPPIKAELYGEHVRRPEQATYEGSLHVGELRKGKVVDVEVIETPMSRLIRVVS